MMGILELILSVGQPEFSGGGIGKCVFMGFMAADMLSSPVSEKGIPDLSAPAIIIIPRQRENRYPIFRRSAMPG